MGAPAGMHGAAKAGHRVGTDYIQTPGTTMGVGQFYDQGRANQLFGQLDQTMQGGMPSVAENLMRGGLDQIQRGMTSTALTGGGNPLVASRNAMQAGAQAGLQANSQFGAMRADEMERARQAFMGMLQQQMGLEGVAAQNYGTVMGGPTKGDTRSDFEKFGMPLLGAGIGAGGAALGGYLGRG